MSTMKPQKVPDRKQLMAQLDALADRWLVAIEAYWNGESSESDWFVCLERNFISVEMSSTSLGILKG